MSLWAARTSVDAQALEDVEGRAQVDDTAVILCTSGTTGDPREVELTHGNLVANLQGSVQKVDLGPNDVLGHILPPHHSFGMTVGKFLPLVAGATSIYTNKYREVSDLIREKGITIFIAIPALYTTLAKKLEEGINKQKKEQPDRGAARPLRPRIPRQEDPAEAGLDAACGSSFPGRPRCRAGCWKSCGGGASRCTRATARRRTRRSTASTTGSTSSARSASRSIPWSSRSWTRTTARSRRTQRGEICLGGPCIAKGYYKNPKATEAVIDKDAEGVRWLHTGDLGYLDEDGNLYITGRKKYLIILPGGKNVNPERVETALSEARFVREVLVVPSRREDDNGLMEESVRAIVQPAWETLESHTGRSQRELLAEPQLVKNLIWESIRDCQQQNKQLSHFEKVAAHNSKSSRASSSRPPPARSNASTTSTWSTWRPSTRGSRSTSPRRRHAQKPQ